jgi:hypothetical protein
MSAIRQVFDDAPDSVSIPAALRHRRLEIVFLPLDEAFAPIEHVDLPAAWPEGFFEQTAGALPDLPEREPQGEHQTREPLE